MNSSEPISIFFTLETAEVSLFFFTLETGWGVHLYMP
jgi:hypothetical protein